MSPIDAWQVRRPYKCCEALCCYDREAVRTNAIRTNGKPLSLCAEHWEHYRQAMPEDLRPREPLPTL